MDASRFDSLARSLHDVRSRRGAFSTLLGGTLGLLSLAETAAKKGKGKGKGKDKKKKKKGNGDTDQNPSPPPPPGVAPTCADNVKNGSESDIDCGGGACPRCANSKSCATRDDCAGAFCANGTCQACTAASQCGYGSDGFTCGCSASLTGGSMVCHNSVASASRLPGCYACPPGTVHCFRIQAGEFSCYSPCGAP